MSLFCLKEVGHTNGDLRLLEFPNNHDIEFPFPRGARRFRMQIYDLVEIRPVTDEHLPQYADVIRRSFATVAKDSGWTKENAPGHVSFRTDDQLSNKSKDGYFPFCLFVGEIIIGFVSLTDKGKGAYELNKLSVLPEWRHFGYGKKLLDFCIEKTKELGGSKITLDIIEENIILKNWYAVNGFVHTGTKKFKHLPFTTGYMEWESGR